MKLIFNSIFTTTEIELALESLLLIAAVVDLLFYQNIPSIEFTKCDINTCQLVFKYQQIEGPKNNSQLSCWLKAMHIWRDNERKAINYSDHNYRKEEFKWTQKNPIQPQMMAHERDFYDPINRRYTVDKYVERMKERYGGIDSVLVWPTYPNLGIDDRNTDDLIRDMPGGVAGIRQMIDDFHRHEIKVIFPIHPWDIGTRDPGNSWSAVLPETMAELNADGLNGDTMETVDKEYFDNAIADKHPLVLEPELGFNAKTLKGIEWNLMSWAEIWNADTFRPLISKYKWFETRHQLHICDRWSKTKIRILQSAFFNGIGLETWENVWSVWNQMTDRDCMATKMVAIILREFYYLFVSDQWIPYYNTLNDSVFASKWTANTSLTLFTLINRSSNNITGDQIEVDYSEEFIYLDVWHGKQLIPHITGEKALLNFPIEANGFGAIVFFKQKDSPKDISKLMTTMKTYSQHSLSYYSASNSVLNQKMTPINKTKLYEIPPEGMILIPSANYTFSVRGNEIEGDSGVDVQYEWEQFPIRFHKHVIKIQKFFIDKTPVTNKQFENFLNNSHYSPNDSHNFLRDWINGRFQDGWDNKPVTWVSLEDSRQYCKWNGKRLPHEWEWQYSAQGLDGRLYPWGNTFDEKRVPKPIRGRNVSSPDDVNAHTDGSSPFGVLDLVGNVWQWTDEYIDEHTRSAVLRGGSHYQPKGSDWYFPNGEKHYKLDEHNKYLLMAPALDRSATLGFRCAADSQ